MLIVCPSCASRYSIDDGKIGLAGRTVRCASCRHSFFVALPQAVETHTGDMFEGAALRGTAEDDTSLRDFAAAMAFQAGTEESGGGLVAPPKPLVNGQPPLDPGILADTGLVPAKSESTPAAGSVPAAGLPGVSAPGTRLQLDVMAARETKPQAEPAPDSKLVSFVRKIIAPLRIIPPSLASAGLAVALLGGLIVERVDVVRQFPETAGLYAAFGYPVNLRGLSFRNVVTEVVQEGEARVLVVEGDIANVEDRTISVPLIAISVRGENGAQLYTWTSEPQRPKLGAGELIRFRARLVSPPAEGKQVLVRFAGRETDMAIPPVKASGPEVPAQPTRGNVKEFK